MTAKREAELETENRMLREQVASLERIIACMQPAVRVDGGQLVPYAAPQPWPGMIWCGTETVSSGGSTAVLS